MGKRYVLVNGQRVEKVCLNCGNKFYLKRDSAGKYCSNLCWVRSNEHDEVNRKSFKDKKLSPEHVEKMAASKRGKKQSKELIDRRMAWVHDPNFHWEDETIQKRANANRDKKRAGVARENILNGLAKSFGYSTYAELESHPRKNYTLKHERDQKALARQRDHNTCLLCGDQERLHVHHLIDVRRFPPEQQDTTAHELKNLITLCRTCHKKLMGYKKTNYLKAVSDLQGVLNKKYGYVYDWVLTRTLLGLPLVEIVN